MKLVAAFVCGVCTILAGRADAQAWRLVQANDRTLMIADADSVRTVGSDRLIWSAMARLPPEEGIWYNLVRFRVDCAMETMSAIYLASYDFGGNSTMSGNLSEEPDSVVPGSLLSGVLKAACDDEWPSENTYNSLDEMLGFLRPAAE